MKQSRGFRRRKLSNNEDQSRVNTREKKEAPARRRPLRIRELKRNSTPFSTGWRNLIRIHIARVLSKKEERKKQKKNGARQRATRERSTKPAGGRGTKKIDLPARR